MVTTKNLVRFIIFLVTIAVSLPMILFTYEGIRSCIHGIITTNLFDLLCPSIFNVSVWTGAWIIYFVMGIYWIRDKQLSILVVGLGAVLGLTSLGAILGIGSMVWGSFFMIPFLSMTIFLIVPVSAAIYWSWFFIKRRATN